MGVGTSTQTSLPLLVDQARAVASELRAVLDELGQSRSASVSAGAALQERLRVGVRMLKAFQVQIEQLEVLLSEPAAAARRADQVLDRMDQRVATAEDRAEAMVRLVESAEVNIAVLAYTAARNAGA